MRLCFVGTLSSVHNRRWAGFFADQGHDVHVISPSPTKGNEPSNITVYELTTNRTGNYVLDLILGFFALPLRVAEFRRLFRAIAPDIVHVHYLNDAALYSLLAGFRPIVLTGWGDDIRVSPEESWIRKLVAKYVVRRMDLMTCDADHMKRAMVDLGGDPERVKIIFFGTDVEQYRPGQRDSKLREKVAPNQALVVISIRNLEPEYDLETLVRSVPVVCGRFPKVTFLIAGSGSLAGALHKLTLELGVEENVHFLGALSQSELPVHLASSDVYVSTALRDGGIAASTAEAMASAVPVVVTDVGDNSQWVEDGMNGLLFPEGNSQVLGKQILQLLEDPELRSRMGIAGREVIVQRNNMQQEMSRMEFLYEELRLPNLK